MTGPLPKLTKTIYTQISVLLWPPHLCRHTAEMLCAQFQNSLREHCKSRFVVSWAYEWHAHTTLQSSKCATALCLKSDGHAIIKKISYRLKTLIISWQCGIARPSMCEGRSVHEARQNKVCLYLLNGKLVTTLLKCAWSDQVSERFPAWSDS